VDLLGAGACVGRVRSSIFKWSRLPTLGATTNGDTKGRSPLTGEVALSGGVKARLGKPCCYVASSPTDTRSVANSPVKPRAVSIRRAVLLACRLLASRLLGGYLGPVMSDVTQILNAIAQGDAHAAEQLLPLVYDELRRLAAQKMVREESGQTLRPTALVHEAYLRLVGGLRE
jgi:hypothetical protein